MFLHLCVILFTGGGGFPACNPLGLPTGVVCIQGELDRPPLPEMHGKLLDTVNKRVVRILLECFLVSLINASSAEGNDPLPPGFPGYLGYLRAALAEVWEVSL